MHVFTKALALSVTMALLTSCASIIEGSSDEVNVSTPGAIGMPCTATNERGSWSGIAPGKMIVKKSRTDLKVNCTDQNTGATAGSTVISDVEPWVFGNILLGGIVGLGVDWITGAAYDYPESTSVSPTVAAPAVNYIPAPAPVIPPEPVGAPLYPNGLPAQPAPGSATAPAPGVIYYPATPSAAAVNAPAAAAPAQGTIAPLPFGGPTPAPSY